MYNKRIQQENQELQKRVRELAEQLKWAPVVSRATGRYNRETVATRREIEEAIAAEFSEIPRDRRRRNVTSVLMKYKPT